LFSNWPCQSDWLGKHLRTFKNSDCEGFAVPRTSVEVHVVASVERFRDRRVTMYDKRAMIVGIV